MSTPHEIKIVREWQAKNKNKVKASKQRAKDRREQALKAELTKIDRSGIKTPVQAIKRFCGLCHKREDSRRSSTMPHAIVQCTHRHCPLFSFKNGEPVRVLMGKRLNNIAIKNMQDGRKQARE